MDSLRNLVTRGLGDDNNSSTVNLLIAVLSLVFFGLLLIALLTLLRRMRRRQAMMASQTLPKYADAQPLSGDFQHLTIETRGMDRSSVIVFRRDGQPMLANPRSPPHASDNVPAIHITFPDEHDDQGRKTGAGRVVLVRVGENGVGLEPLPEDEQLPAYEKDSKTPFYAIDMDQIGGLREKDRRLAN